MPEEWPRPCRRHFFFASPQISFQPACEKQPKHRARRERHHRCRSKTMNGWSSNARRSLDVVAGHAGAAAALAVKTRPTTPVSECKDLIRAPLSLHMVDFLIEREETLLLHPANGRQVCLKLIGIYVDKRDCADGGEQVCG